MTKIKICGITSVEDALFATQAGVDYLGFIINHPPSPRSLPPLQVQVIIQAVRQDFPNLSFVGVFVDEPVASIKKLIHELGLNVVQLHGTESPETCHTLRQHAEVWKAIEVHTVQDLEQLIQFWAVADKIVFDNGRGSGQMIDVDLLKGISVDVLAGGLGPNNVGQTIARIHPEIVDCNSGVEIVPGKKDYRLIQEAINIVRNFL